MLQRLTQVWKWLYVFVQEAWLVVNQMHTSLTAKCAGIQFGRTVMIFTWNVGQTVCECSDNGTTTATAMSRSGRAVSDVLTATSLGM